MGVTGSEFDATFSDARRALVIESEPHTPHLETGLEIANRLHRAGVEVTYSAYQYAECSFGSRPWPVHFRDTTTGRKTNFVHMLERGVTVNNKSISARHLRTQFPDVPSSIQEIAEYEIDGINVGLGAVSSAAHRLRSTSLSETASADIVKEFLRISLDSYYRTMSQASELQLDVVVAFNGRFASAYGSRRAAQKLGINYVAHERGGDNSRFSLWKNSSPHSMPAWRDRFTAASHAGLHERAEASRITELLTERGFSPLGKQLPRAIPEDLLARAVVYFTSSFAEYAYTGFHYFEPWTTEQEAVSVLASVCKKLKVPLILRMHPNMESYGQDEKTLWSDALQRFPEIVVVQPDDQCDSYELMMRAALVATGLSTVGLEAALRKRPVLILGDAPYVPAIGSVRGKSETEIQLAVTSSHDIRPNATGALAFAVFQLLHGTAYDDYAPTGQTSGTFRGRGRYQKFRKGVRKKARNRCRQLMQFLQFS